MNEPFSIDNQREYPAELVEELREALASGVTAYPDPKRENFYDIENDERVFFICVSPANGKVTLLATWLEELVACTPGTVRVFRKLAS